jgi:hypothetical protein
MAGRREGMNKFEKLHKQLNDQFRDDLKIAMKEKGVEVESKWSFVLDKLVTYAVNGTNMMPEQMDYLKGFSDGYAKAKSIIPWR